MQNLLATPISAKFENAIETIKNQSKYILYTTHYTKPYSLHILHSILVCTTHNIYLHLHIHFTYLGTWYLVHTTQCTTIMLLGAPFNVTVFGFMYFHTNFGVRVYLFSH